MHAELVHTASAYGFNPRRCTNGSQRFAAKSKRHDILKVSDFKHLACRVTAKSKRHIVIGYPTAVIGYTHISDAAALYFHGNIQRTSVNRVLAKLLDNRARSLNNLAGGNQLIYAFVKLVNFRHFFSVQTSSSSSFITMTFGICAG